MDRLLRQHAQFMAARVSPNTAKNYGASLRRFASWLDETERAVQDVKGTDIEHYMDMLADSGLSPQTINCQKAAIQHFYKWAERHEHIEPVASRFWVPKIKEPVTLPKPIARGEVMALIDGVDTSSVEGLRDRAIIECLYGTGMRLSECLSLRLSDISKDGQTARVVNGKGSKERQVPIVPCRVTLTRWMQERFKLLPTTDTVFVSVTGREMSPRSVQKMVHRRGVEAGLEERVTPHRLRHSYATHLVDAGADLAAVKELMGHTNIATTMRYVEVSAERLANVVGSMHPLVANNG